MHNKPALFTEQLARRLKHHVEESDKHRVPPLAENKAGLLAGYTSPVEIVSSWTLEGEVWKCRAHRLWRIDGAYRQREESTEFDLYHPTSAEHPGLGIGERVFALFRGVWELVSGTGTAGSGTIQARLVQPKELFPACEYKSVQDVYDCTLEYSDDKSNWTEACQFDIIGGRTQITYNHVDTEPHQYWRVNLKGFSQPEEMNDPEADRGFYTFGRLWEVQFWTNNVAIYTLSQDEETGELPFDSKPLTRKAQHHRYLTITFYQPVTITAVTLDVDQHIEHYIVCPGGRDAHKEDIPFIYAFDLADEKWTALTFPEMQKPMFNMDAKVVELADKSHQLIVLSGQVASGFSNIIQGYNFEKDYIQNVVDTGNSGLNFAGRPALVGDPMLRSGQVTSRPDGESDFLRSVMVVGGSERSCFIRGTNQAIDSVLFSVQGSTLAIGMPYETSTLNISLSNSGHTGLPFGFFDYRTYASQAGAVGTKLQNLGTFTRHQNLPVRGILRRRPQGNTTQPSNTNPVIDFLLLGGFNIVGREAYNNKIVSGIFNSPTPSAANAAVYSMLISSPHFSANNTNNFLYYPDCDKVLGDCCAEYIEERDEIICFGGRANESDTAVAHAVPATLVFDSDSNAAQWNYTKYPPMPNPRWSAASVLIKDLVRQGETESCDRIFIIGGRNREGLVPEVDVINLRYNEWETDWKGLNEGELESYTPAGGGQGGGTVIIQNGGGKTIIAGEGITITESGNNLIIEAAGLMWE